jgi:hypothetical protein
MGSNALLRTWERSGRVASGWALTLAIALRPAPAAAWTLPEHSAIGDFACANGVCGHRLPRLTNLWQRVLDDQGDLLPLCAHLSTPSEMLREEPATPTIRCVSFSDLAALAADHADSVADLDAQLRAAATALRQHPASDDRGDRHWLFNVLDEGRDARESFAQHGGFPVPVENLNAYRLDRDDRRDDINLHLAVFDGGYVDRGAANFAHFHIPRRSESEPFDLWLARSLRVDRPLNAASAFALYHALALRFADELRARIEDPNADPRHVAALAWRVLLLESHALHFVEDAFSTGHFIDFSESSAVRNGTHDHFCSRGANVRTWSGHPYLAMGDAHLSAHDIRLAATAVRTALKQVEDVLRDGLTHDTGIPPRETAPTDFDVGHERLPPPWVADLWRNQLVRDVVWQQPAPSDREHRRSGSVEFSSDRGVYLIAGLRQQWGLALARSGALTSNDMTANLMGELGLALNVDGLLASRRDGSAFLLSALVGGEVTRESPTAPDPTWLFGLRVRLPLVPLLWSLARVPTSRWINASLFFYTLIIDSRARVPFTDIALSRRVGPESSVVALNPNEVSLLWTRTSFRVQLPILYYLLRQERPHPRPWDGFGRVELGLSYEDVFQGPSVFSIYLGVNVSARYLVSNVGPP